MEAVIQLTPEQRLVVSKAVEAGIVKSAQEGVDVGLQELRRELLKASKSRKKLINIVVLLEGSPLKGVELDLERDQSPERVVEL